MSTNPKQFSVSLDPELVERAKSLYQKYGTKLSPLLNQLLLEWCDNEESSNE